MHAWLASLPSKMLSLNRTARALNMHGNANDPYKKIFRVRDSSVASGVGFELPYSGDITRKTPTFLQIPLEMHACKSLYTNINQDEVNTTQLFSFS